MSPNNTPSEVATPLPPLNRSQIGKLWPRMHAVAAAVAVHAGSPLNRIAIHRATSTEATPFNTSRTNTGSPYRQPQTRHTFVAPMFPLPCCRMSSPFIRDTRRPNGTEPST